MRQSEAMSDTIERLRALLARATELPWKSDPWDQWKKRILITDKRHDEIALIYNDDIAHKNAHANLALVPAAVNALPALLDVAEAARALDEMLVIELGSPSDGYEDVRIGPVTGEHSQPKLAQRLRDALSALDKVRP
jgi:hypothetical protein